MDATVRSASTGRLVALDHLRGCVVLLVVLHHSILAYCTFGHVDRRHYALSTAPIVDVERWGGFDALVLLNDAYFMPLLFLLSGLFVWGGLVRRGPWRFLRGRLLRLGVPFAAAALTVVPLAYYPSFLQAGGQAGFGAYWLKTVTTGPWPSGPPWFLAVLLTFDFGAAMAFVFAGRRGPVRGSMWWLAWLLGLSAAAYLPLLYIFGASRWVGVGPVAVQGSRIGLYAVYFAAGVGLGRSIDQTGFPLGRALAGCWAAWAVAAGVTGAVFLAVDGLPRWMAMGARGVALATFCAAASVALIAGFQRFSGRRSAVADSVAANSFGIYLLHYPAVTWVQHALLGLEAGAIAKGAATFAAAAAGSWTLTLLTRRALERLGQHV